MWPRSNRLRWKALRARISARSLRERVKAREGAEAAGNRFRQVRTGLRTERRLQVVQIDHTKVDIMLVDRCDPGLHRSALADAGAGRAHAHGGRLPPVASMPPSATAAALAIAQAVLPKLSWLKQRDIDFAWPVHGLPDVIHVDNGREFHSRAFERRVPATWDSNRISPPRNAPLRWPYRAADGHVDGSRSRLSGFDVVQLRRSREL